jgi:hypothetical protein
VVPASAAAGATGDGRDKGVAGTSSRRRLPSGAVPSVCAPLPRLLLAASVNSTAAHHLGPLALLLLLLGLLALPLAALPAAS